MTPRRRSQNTPKNETSAVVDVVEVKVKPIHRALALGEIVNLSEQGAATFKDVAHLKEAVEERAVAIAVKPHGGTFFEQSLAVASRMQETFSDDRSQDMLPPEHETAVAVAQPKEGHMPAAIPWKEEKPGRHVFTDPDGNKFVLEHDGSMGPAMGARPPVGAWKLSRNELYQGVKDSEGRSAEHLIGPVDNPPFETIEPIVKSML